MARERVGFSMRPHARAHRAMPLLSLCAALFLPAGCGRTYVLTDRGPQAFYQTSPPLRDTSGEIERIFRSVKRVQVTGIYRTYRFSREARITDADLSDRSTYARATERYSSDHSKSGTAVVISANASSVVLLTNAHVTALPDTVVTHFGERTGAGTPPSYVASVAILSDRSDVVLDLAGTRSFTVLAEDPEKDLAAVRVQFRPAERMSGVDPLGVPRGEPARLSWASFVYVLGYPGGYKMVTRAIVSDPDRTRDHAFLLDGLFNRGMSGGLILGVRSETGALEWLGLVTSAAGDTEDLLLPERRDIDADGLVLPYDGPLYIERAVRIRYGITFSVSVTAIESFLRAVGVPRRPVLPVGQGGERS